MQRVLVVLIVVLVVARDRANFEEVWLRCGQGLGA
jgi:hypothetical protein